MEESRPPYPVSGKQHKINTKSSSTKLNPNEIVKDFTPNDTVSILSGKRFHSLLSISLGINTICWKHCLDVGLYRQKRLLLLFAWLYLNYGIIPITAIRCPPSMYTAPLIASHLSYHHIQKHSLHHSICCLISWIHVLKPPFSILTRAFCYWSTLNDLEAALIWFLLPCVWKSWSSHLFDLMRTTERFLILNSPRKKVFTLTSGICLAYRSP